MNKATGGVPGLAASTPAGPNHVTIYTVTPETGIYRTVGVEVMTDDSLLSATERVAAYIYEDLRELTGRASFSLAQVAEMPPVSTNDPNLFHRLLCMDIEHLLRDRHTTDVALLLSDPAPNAEGKIPLRFCASYHVVRLVDWAKSVEDADSGGRTVAAAGSNSPPSRVTRQGERYYDPARYSSEREGQFALAIKWNPQTAATRETGMRYPQYHFHWSPARNITFDDRALQTTGSLTRASNVESPAGATPAMPEPSPAGLSPELDGVWSLNTIRHAVPNAHRPRPEKMPRPDVGS